MGQAGQVRQARGVSNARGYVMAALLVAIAAMGILMSVALPVWRQSIQREKEEELIFRGNQYVRAIGLFQRKNPGGYPPNVDFLVKQKFLRKKFKDPMVEDGEFQLIPLGAVGQAGQTAGTLRQGATARGLTGTSAARGGQSAGFTGGAFSSNFTGPFAGVVSKSTEKSIKIYNGKDHYNEWLFVYSAATGVGGAGGPGQGGRGRGRGQGQGPQRGMGRGTGRGQMEVNPEGRGRGGRGFGPGGGRGGFDQMQVPPPGGGRGR